MKTENTLRRGFLLCLVLIFSCTLGITAQNGSGDEMPNSIAVSSNDYPGMQWIACPPPIDGEGCHFTILQGDPSKPNSDILFRLGAGKSVPEHWHSSAERMVMYSGELHVTYKGEDTQVLKPGDYAYGPPNKPHYAKCADGGDDCLFFIAFEKPVDSFVEEGE